MLINFGNKLENHEDKEFFLYILQTPTRAAITRWLIEDKDISPKNLLNSLELQWKVLL